MLPTRSPQPAVPSTQLEVVVVRRRKQLVMVWRRRGRPLCAWEAEWMLEHVARGSDGGCEECDAGASRAEAADGCEAEWSVWWVAGP